MFGLFWKGLRWCNIKPKQIAFVGSFFFIKTSPYWMNEANAKINQKFKDTFDSLYSYSKKKQYNLTEQQKSNMLIFAGNSNPELAAEIGKILRIPLGGIKVGRFSDGEVSCQVIESVRAKNVFIIQSTCPPVNDNLMELIMMVSSMRKASAKKINVVIPYYGYARRDRKAAPRVPIAAADVATLLETVGVDRVVLVDVHSGQIQGFFGPRVNVDNLQANLAGLNYLFSQSQIPMQKIAVISPDEGGVARAKNFQSLIKNFGISESSFAIIIKQRMTGGKIGSMHLIGDVENKNCIIVDDIIDTARTICQATKVLKENGANSISVFSTHGVFSGNALDNLRKSSINKIIVTNSIPPVPFQNQLTDGKLIRLTIAPLLAEAIYRIQTKKNMMNLFKAKP